MFLSGGFGWALRICGFILPSPDPAAAIMIGVVYHPGQDHNSLRSTFSAHLRIPFLVSRSISANQLKIIDKISTTSIGMFFIVLVSLLFLLAITVELMSAFAFKPFSLSIYLSELWSYPWLQFNMIFYSVSIFERGLVGVIHLNLLIVFI